MAKPVVRGDTKPLSARLLVSQVAAYIPATIIPAFIGLLSSAAYTRLLSATSYGEYSLTISIASLITTAVVQWLQQAVNRYLPGSTEAEERAQIKIVVIHGLAIIEFIILTLGLITLASLREYKFTVPTILFVLLSAVFGLTGAVLQAEMRGGRYSMFHVLNSVLKFGLSLFLIVLLPLHSSLLIWGSAVSLLLLVPFMWKSAGLPSITQATRRVDPVTRSVLAKFSKYGLPMGGWFLASGLLNTGDRYVIQWFRGSAEVGIYAANYQLISGAIGLITGPALLAAHPFLMRAWSEGDAGASAGWLGKIVELLSILGITVVALTTLFSEDIARCFLGEEFRVGHVLMPVLLAAVVTWNLAMYLQKPLEFTECTITMLEHALATATLNMLLNFLFVPNYGYSAAAWTTLASYASYAIVVGVTGRRRMRWQVRWGMLLGVSVAGVAMVVTGVWVRRLTSISFGYWGGFLGAVLVASAFAFLLLLRLWNPVVAPLVRCGSSRSDAMIGSTRNRNIRQ